MTVWPKRQEKEPLTLAQTYFIKNSKKRPYRAGNDDLLTGDL